MLKVDGEAHDPVVLRAPDLGADVRATAVLAVLGGVSPETVAARYDLAPSILDRWVRTFVAAGRTGLEDDEGHAAEESATESAGEGQVRAGSTPDHDRYLSLVAHELRSPLAMIQGWAELLGDGTADAAVVVHAVRGIGANVARLRRLADDALDAAAVAQGRLELQLVTTALGPLLCEIVAARADQVPAPVVEGDVVVRVDPDRLGQILDNLLENARKHGDGISALRVHRRDEVAEITVTSPGDAIADDVARRMFRPFERGASGAQGVGLGLYVCRSLVSAHGGQIGVRSDGAGNHFWVRLPLAS